MKLTTTSIEGYKVLAYTYKATPGMTCTVTPFLNMAVDPVTIDLDKEPS